MNDPNPPEHEIDAEYARLVDRPLRDLAALIPHFRFWQPYPCDGTWYLICRCAEYPTATMFAAAEVLVSRLGLEPEVKWQRLELHS